MDTNRVELIGRVGKIDGGYTEKGVARLSLRVATARPGKRGPDAEKDWHDVTIWAKLAEAMEGKVQVGDSVAIEGWLRVTGKKGEPPRCNIQVNNILVLRGSYEPPKEAYKHEKKDDTGKKAPADAAVDDDEQGPF